MLNIVYLLTCNIIKRREKIGNYWCCRKSQGWFNLFLSECAVVDHSEKDEEMSSDSPTDATDSDEDFTPNKATTTKRKLRHARKSQTSQNENVSTNKL